MTSAGSALHNGAMHIHGYGAMHSLHVYTSYQLRPQRRGCSAGAETNHAAEAHLSRLVL